MTKPLSEDELRRKAGAIKTITLGVMGAAAAAQLIALFFWLSNRDSLLLPTSLAGSAGIAISAVTYWLVRSGKVRFASYFFVLGFLAEGAIITTLFGGFIGPLSISYLFPILVAGILISVNAGFFVATLAAILYLGMIPVENAGLLRQLLAPYEQGVALSYLAVGTHLVFFYLVAFLSWFAASRLSQALVNMRRYAVGLRTANEKLQASEEELRTANEELRVTEEELRASNDELEAANRKLWESQEQLVRSERLAAIGELAGGVGHELRNPLGAIKNAVYYVKGKVAKSELAESEPRVMQFLNIVDEEANASNKIIKDLLGFSRLAKPARSPVEVKGIIDGALCRVFLPEHVSLDNRASADSIEVNVDADQIQQVLVNIITNAVQAMPQGGTLAISTGERGGFQEVTIADSGAGIPEQVRGKIFEPLFTTRAKGIGLGLAISKSIIDRHGGHIEVQSRVGEGTAFTIMLPKKETGLGGHFGEEGRKIQRAGGG
jgi:signal transduction histidine kinase